MYQSATVLTEKGIGEFGASAIGLWVGLNKTTAIVGNKPVILMYEVSFQ